MLHSTVEMAMKLLIESKDGFGMSLHTLKDTGLIMMDWTYSIIDSKVPVFVRSCRAQTLTLQPQLLI